MARSKANKRKRAAAQENSDSKYKRAKLDDPDTEEYSPEDGEVLSDSPASDRSSVMSLRPWKPNITQVRRQEQKEQRAAETKRSQEQAEAREQAEEPAAVYPTTLLLGKNPIKTLERLSRNPTGVRDMAPRLDTLYHNSSQSIWKEVIDREMNDGLRQELQLQQDLTPTLSPREVLLNIATNGSSFVAINGPRHREHAKAVLAAYVGRAETAWSYNGRVRPENRLSSRTAIPTYDSGMVQDDGSASEASYDPPPAFNSINQTAAANNSSTSNLPPLSSYPKASASRAPPPAPHPESTTAASNTKAKAGKPFLSEDNALHLLAQSPDNIIGNLRIFPNGLEYRMLALKLNELHRSSPDQARIGLKGKLRKAIEKREKFEGRHLSTVELVLEAAIKESEHMKPAKKYLTKYARRAENGRYYADPPPQAETRFSSPSADDEDDGDSDAGMAEDDEAETEASYDPPAAFTAVTRPATSAPSDPKFSSAASFTPTLKVHELSPHDRDLQERYFNASPESDVHCLCCAALGHLADFCPARVCAHCQSDTHFSSACPTHIKCARCRRRGHKARDCKSLTSIAPGGPNDPCDYCGGYGHVEEVCSSLWRSYAPDPATVKKIPSHEMVRACFNCGMAGHFGGDCPDLPRFLAESKGRPPWCGEWARAFTFEEGGDDDAGVGVMGEYGANRVNPSSSYGRQAWQVGLLDDGRD
ncbi:uncharacterized protein LTR77_009601 [Saxophila tyrrhenica]|uniref:CCHC-type domain-containing protein n=1 Tax=Saxophila tyrrhenica TaxID=1690608 RepID=A0AAV9NZY7_9PEZI|nr:hypothetical protein LTR77_009601 [Saxophila tyrrhenica]